MQRPYFAGRDCLRALLVPHPRRSCRQIHFLRTMPLFSGWTKPRLARLTTILNSATATAGHVLLRQGSPSDVVMLIRKGTVELRVRAPTARTRGLLLAGVLT